MTFNTAGSSQGSGGNPKRLNRSDSKTDDSPQGSSGRRRLRSQSSLNVNVESVEVGSGGGGGSGGRQSLTPQPISSGSVTPMRLPPNQQPFMGRQQLSSGGEQPSGQPNPIAHRRSVADFHSMSMPSANS